MKKLLLILGAAWICIAAPVFAQGGGTMRIVVAFPPGGPVDFVARILGEGLAKELALFAPANTSPARIDQLNAAVRRVLTSEAARTRLFDSGTEPAPGRPGELAALVKSDTSKWSRIIRDKKIKGE